MNILLPAFLLFVLFKWGYSKPIGANYAQSAHEMAYETCLYLSGYRRLDENNTFYRVMEVSNFNNVSLPCSFCGEANEDLPRVWLWRPRLRDSTFRELKLGLEPKLEDNRVFSFPNHTLIIHNVTTEDAGLYYCFGLTDGDTAKFQFNLDVVTPDVTLVEKKTSTSWAKYNNEFITHVNERIYESSSEDMRGLLDKVKVRAYSEWAPWLPCDGCTGLRMRYAKCRLHMALNKVKYPNITDEDLDEIQSIIHQSAVLSCHSLDLARWNPFLFTVTSAVPNFLEVQNCIDSCPTKQRMALHPRYEFTMNMEAGTSMAFVCPESNLRSNVIWRKDGTLIKPMRAKIPKEPEWYPHKMEWLNPVKKATSGFTLPRAFVGRMHILHLCLVGDRQSGVYVCYVDNMPIKSFNITVVTDEETKRQRHHHFWLLSIYTSAISGVVVLVGIFWAIVNRDEFGNVRPFMEEADLDNSSYHTASSR